jgi:quinol monooxygenase YgiN
MFSMFSFLMLSMAALIGLAFLESACTQKASNPPQSGEASKSVYIVTHIDVMPNFSDGANKAIQKYAADSRADQGAMSIEGLVQDGRPNHFTIVEIWQSREAFEAHSGQAHVREFRETLQPMLGAPFDERLHAPMP